MTRRLIGPLVIMVMLIMVGCGIESGGEEQGDDLTVLAAASLTEAFTTIGERYETDHPGTSVRFSFGSSATLASQITEGAPADVLATADEQTMQAVQQDGLLASEPRVFATNSLQIAVPAGNPGDVRDLADFADPDKVTALCAEQVPCGRAARQIFENAGITPRPATYERDVKAALQKVVQGEVDAAMVYATDVRAGGDAVQGIDVAGADAVINNYPIAIVGESADQQAARSFVDYVSSDAGQQVLHAAGFGPP